MRSLHAGSSRLGVPRQRQARISVITWIEVLVGCNSRDFPLELGGIVHPYRL